MLNLESQIKQSDLLRSAFSSRTLKKAFRNVLPEVLFLNTVMSAGLVLSLVSRENFSLTHHGCHVPVSTASLDGPECIRFSIGNVMLKIPAGLKVNTDRTLNSLPRHDWPSSRGQYSNICQTSVALIVHTLVFLSFFFNHEVFF